MYFYRSLVLSAFGLVSNLGYAESEWVALSKMDDFKAATAKARVSYAQDTLADLKIEGADADSFKVVQKKLTDGNLELEIAFDPQRKRGIYKAELQVLEKTVQLRGLGSKYEPTLQEVLGTLGASLNAGGKIHNLDTEGPTIGDSIDVSEFEPIAGEALTITPLARFSPDGEVPFGFAVKEGENISLKAFADLAAASEQRPDTHKSLFPSLKDGKNKILLKDPPKRFGFFMKGHLYTSLTYAGKSKGAKIKHTARIYPVKQLRGKPMKNAYLVGFEEAANGDYQDLLMLVEGVKIVK